MKHFAPFLLKFAAVLIPVIDYEEFYFSAFLS